MFDIRSRPVVPRRRPAREAWLLALIVATASAAISATAYNGYSGTSTPAAAHAASAPHRHPAGSVALRDDSSSLAAPTNGSGAGDQAAAAVPRHPAPPTMSMDDPIQGGLTAHQEQALSARLLSAHQDAAVAAKSTYWTPAVGRTAAARAESWLGMPYSWAGGNAAGPTPGRCDPANGADLDCHVVGFDCSGLSMYAWGPYASLPHYAESQRAVGGFHPTLDQLRPGDLVFFSAYLPGGIGHVGIYTGKGMVVEAPQSGSVVRRSTLASMMAADGTYRGAVRPLTAPDPTLTAPHTAVPTAGGTVTLHGTNLAGVDAVHLATTTVQRFVQHSDTTIVFHAPAHRAGTLPVTVSTSWQATSRPVALRYTAPHVTPPSSSPTSTPPTSTPPTSTPPTSTTPKSTTPKSTTPKSTTPKSTTPKSTTPKSTTPKSTTPKSTTPKSTTPKSTTPKSTTPKSTTPKSTPPPPSPTSSSQSAAPAESAATAQPAATV